MNIPNNEEELPLQWFIDGKLILKNKELIGTARPVCTPEGVVTGFEFIPIKNDSYLQTTRRYSNLRGYVTVKVNKIRELNLSTSQLTAVVEKVRK